MPNDEPLQTDEVVALVTSDKEFAIVHVESYQEVNIHEDIYNKKEPWRIATTLLEIPDKPVLHRALALGFQLSSTETRTRRSNPITLYKLHRTCFGMRAAAIKAFVWLAFCRAWARTLGSGSLCGSMMSDPIHHRGRRRRGLRRTNNRAAIGVDIFASPRVSK